MIVQPVTTVRVPVHDAHVVDRHVRADPLVALQLDLAVFSLFEARVVRRDETVRGRVARAELVPVDAVSGLRVEIAREERLDRCAGRSEPYRRSYDLPPDTRTDGRTLVLPHVDPVDELG